MASFLDWVKRNAPKAATIAADLSPIGLPNAIANKVSGGAIGFDPTPGFGAQNVLTTQYGNLVNNGGSTPGTVYSPDSSQTQQPAVLSANTNSGTTSGGTSYPDTSGLQDAIRAKIQSIQQAYSMLNGNIDQFVQERAGQNTTNYNQQFDNLNRAYQTSGEQLAGAYGARGLGDSSFYGNAQSDAARTYGQNMNSLLQDQQNTNAQLGQYAAQNKAQFGAAGQQYNDLLNNLGQYDANQLSSLDSQLSGALTNAQSTAAGIGTNAEFINGLSQIAPQQNQGATQLAAQLQQLVTSGAPQFAKNQIAQGLIKQAQLNDPNAVAYWNDYYKRLLGQMG